MDSMHEMHFFLHIKYGFFIVTVKVDVAQAISIPESLAVCLRVSGAAIFIR